MRPRTLAILLGVSLVLNVFVIGGFAGVFFGRHFGPSPGAARRNPVMAAADRLDPTDRDVFRALLLDEAQKQGPIQLDAREARRQAAELLRAPTFDRAAAGAALDRARNDDLTVRRAIESDILDFAAKLDQPGRATLADGLAHGFGRFGRRMAGGPPPPAAPASSAAAAKQP